MKCFKHSDTIIYRLETSLNGRSSDRSTTTTTTDSAEICLSMQTKLTVSMSVARCSGDLKRKM